MTNKNSWDKGENSNSWGGILTSSEKKVFLSGFFIGIALGLSLGSVI